MRTFWFYSIIDIWNLSNGKILQSICVDSQKTEKIAQLFYLGDQRFVIVYHKSKKNKKAIEHDYMSRGYDANVSI